ncbi:MAG: HmuY family protein, partial [Longimicrobiales bacterium]
AALALGAAVLVALSLRRPEPPVHAPSAPRPAEVGARLHGPISYTVDARDTERWAFFDFSRGSVVTDPGPREWDLAFRRFDIIVNGGTGFAGLGGALALPDTTLATVDRAPAVGYLASTADSTHALLSSWYDYGFTTHLLTPRPTVYVIRTSDGRYAKLRVRSYYCPGATPGCTTFEYVYQGDGSRTLRPTPR